MGIDFKISDFAYPVSILKMKYQFDRNQWLSNEEIAEYQFSRFKHIIEHAYINVPYYKELFKKNNIVPSDIKKPEDIGMIPVLTKDIIRNNFSSLIAGNARKFRPLLLSTSGTTGARMQFYADKPSNVLEFVYYWRWWGWAGYNIGDVFAELSAEYFISHQKRSKVVCYFNPVARRLLLNSLLLSPLKINDLIAAIKKYNPLFIKGLPSNLYAFAVLLREIKRHGISFRAVFSQGENLLQAQRKAIESAFGCKVFDSYGHMERAVAISQCTSGTYHVHSDYGMAEFPESSVCVSENYGMGPCRVREVIGTTLHNMAMPLIRYKVGDHVALSTSTDACPCGRTFPYVESIAGRSTDIVITPDKRAVTAIYTVFDNMPGILLGQIVQERLDELIVRVVYEKDAAKGCENELIDKIRKFVGDSMKISVIPLKAEEFTAKGKEKNRTVVSKISLENII